jgi:dihydrofolate reductase
MPEREAAELARAYAQASAPVGPCHHASSLCPICSADLADSLIPHDLIDEFRIALNPIILGGGTPLFKPGEKRKLKLVDSRPLTNGIVILRYVPAAK